MNFDHDVIIIGAGVTGCAIARELSRYQLDVLVLEKEEDICSGTSKANSGIVHAGFDAKPGTWKAKMNVRGAQHIRELAKDLDLPYVQNGSMVLCFREEDMDDLRDLYKRGLENGVEGLSILTGDEARAMEPALSEQVVAALYAPTAGIICPFGLTQALGENAAENGVRFQFLTQVLHISRESGGFQVITDQGNLSCRYLVNAAGIYADTLHNQLCSEPLKIQPRRGEYVLLDQEVGDLVHCTIFQLPTALGKGVLVTPTAHGNLLVGPNAEDLEDREDTQTTAAGTAQIKQQALMSVPSVPYGKVITGFAGLRAHGDRGDFVLGEAPDVPGFFEAAAIESPGLTSAPAIGEYLAGLIAEKSGAEEKPDFKATRTGIPQVAKLPPEERARLIAARPEYGNIICRCENISEGEILDAIHRPLGARSMDGIKRRVRQGMGRCQAGFCTPFAMQILARELGIELNQVTKNRPGSELIRG